MSWHKDDWLIAFKKINHKYMDETEKCLIKLFKVVILLLKSRQS